MYLLNKTVKIFLLSLLIGSVAILFLHIQLEALNVDMGHHDSHDYSLIIKNTDTRTKTLKDILPSPIISKILCQSCAFEFETPVSPACLYKSDRHLITKQSSQTYLFNMTFLI
jgi:hypothetical protein